MMHTILNPRDHGNRTIFSPVPVRTNGKNESEIKINYLLRLIELKYFSAEYFTLCIVCVPQMNRTELNPEPYFSSISLLYSTTSRLFLKFYRLYLKENAIGCNQFQCSCYITYRHAQIIVGTEVYDTFR